MAGRDHRDDETAHRTSRESLEEARAAAEETVQKLEEIEEGIGDGRVALPPRAGRRDDDIFRKEWRDAAPPAPSEEIDISRVDTGHAGGGPD